MYSKNIMFFDAEFCQLKSDGVDMLSMAFVKPNGERLYIELQQDLTKCDDFVKEKVLPYLTGNTVSIEEAKKQIIEFCNKEKPTIVADVNQFDWMALCGLFGVWNIPFFYIPMDFSTVLDCNNVDPDINRLELAKSYDIDVLGFKQHNALADTLVLKALYEKIVK